MQSAGPRFYRCFVSDCAFFLFLEYTSFALFRCYCFACTFLLPSDFGQWLQFATKKLLKILKVSNCIHVLFLLQFTQ